MGRLIINVGVTVNGAYEAPAPEQLGGWLVTDPDSMQAGLEMWQAADAMLLGRRTYEGLSAAWPQLADTPGFEAYAARMNGMTKYVASRTLSGPLEWNATLLEGDVADAVRRAKEEHPGNLIVPCAGEFARTLIAEGLVDEFWMNVSPYLWSSGPRIFDGIGSIRLEPTGTTVFPSGMVRLCYRPVPVATATA